MYRQGLTLVKIGDHFGVTRERVRQIIRPLGVLRSDSVRSKTGALDKAAKRARMDADSLRRWGVTYAEKKEYRANGLIPSFVQQRNSAKSRGIAWTLLFSRWLAIWQESGKLELRGRGKGRYVMSRIKDEGGYVMGNVHIQLSTENNREGLAKCRNNKPANTGVLLLYPGLSKPWMACVGHAKLGQFATEGEAVAARQAHIAANGLGKTRAAQQLMAA
jgi:hypothetical protein